MSRHLKLVAYCRKIKISEDELALLIHNCSQIGFKHQSKFVEYIPENRRLSYLDVSNMKEGDSRKLFSKVRSAFKERKKYHVQLFSRGKEWHCFYYTYTDTESEGENHWKLGSHLHYVSYLWSNYRKRQIWESFDKRIIDIQGVHIQLETFSTYGQTYRLQFPSELMKKFMKSQSHDA